MSSETSRSAGACTRSAGLSPPLRWITCVLVIWMLSDLALLSRADLSFVLPVTASAYVLVALGGHFLLRDHISWERWTGIVLITVGVILAEETPARTTKGPPESLL